MRLVRLVIMTGILASSLLLVAACEMGGGQPASPTPAGQSPTNAPVAQPGPNQTPEIPDAGSDSGVVHGILKRVDTQAPLNVDDGVDVFLADIVDTNQQIDVARLDKLVAPRATLYYNGVFVFSNVPPGRYTVAVATPIQETLARNPEKPNDDVIITVEPGKTIDVGELYSVYP